MMWSLDEFQMGALETGVSINHSWILFNNFRFGLIIYPNIFVSYLQHVSLNIR